MQESIGEIKEGPTQESIGEIKEGEGDEKK